MTGFSSDTSGAARTSVGGGRGLREISVIHSALRDLEERPPDQLADPRMTAVPDKGGEVALLVPLVFGFCHFSASLRFDKEPRRW